MSETVRDFPPELAETWEPLGVLGAGAMGKVYEVRHRDAGFPAAAKVTLAPQDENMRSRLIREAQALARVQHPGVVKVHDGGVTAAGDAYLVMERLEGHSLDEAPAPDPRAFMAAVSEALQAVHEAGLLHRDVKPGNLFLTRDGQPKLVDFGLALDAERTRLTATGKVAGTPIYMAPELLRLVDPSPASDWYAFGVTLYALLEGKAPFGAEEFEAVCRGQPYPAPEFRRVAAEDPLRLVLAGLLQSNPRDRLEDAEEIRRGLAGQPLDRYALPTPKEPRTGMPRGLIGVAFLGALLGGFFLGDPAPVPAPSHAPAHPEAAPEVAAPLRVLAATRADWAEVDEAGRALLAEPPDGRVFPGSWYVARVPQPALRALRNSLLGEPGKSLLQRWETLVAATRGWLGALRAVGREHGDPALSLEDPEVRSRLDREVLPRLTHLLEDQLIRWSMGNDPAQVELALLSPEGRGAMQAFVNASQELRFSLEEWGAPPPPPLLHLWILLPRSSREPMAHGPAVLDAVRRAIREASKPSELWWAARSLRVLLDFGPWFKDLPWTARLDAISDLRKRLNSLGLRPPHRAQVAAQILPEIGRLGRLQEAPEGRARLRAEVEAWDTLLAESSSSRPILGVLGRFQTWATVSYSEGPWFNDAEASEFRRWYRETYQVRQDRDTAEHGYEPLHQGELADIGLPPPRP